MKIGHIKKILIIRLIILILLIILIKKIEFLIVNVIHFDFEMILIFNIFLIILHSSIPTYNIKNSTSTIKNSTSTFKQLLNIPKNNSNIKTTLQYNNIIYDINSTHSTIISKSNYKLNKKDSNRTFINTILVVILIISLCIVIFYNDCCKDDNTININNIERELNRI